MFIFKYICLVIYSIGVPIFMHYINLIHWYHFYKDWFFCNIKNASAFDYIVVGAGTAGSILAARLSNAGAKTLLIEAGGAPEYFFNIPVFTPLLAKSPFDWQYLTVPQENACKALTNNQSVWTAGKILGGSSRLNYMLYVKGHPEDYKSWFYDFKEPIVRNGGLLHTSNESCHSKVTDSVLQGIVEMSYPLRNINEEPLTGFMKAHHTIRNGERWGTDKVLNTSNKKLDIITNSLVKQILFKSNKAVGVEFYKNNKNYKSFAKEGVIVSAGTVGSSKLLMLSGIGPKEHLNQNNIKTIADLPVGQNLMDHILTGIDLVTLDQDVAVSLLEIANPYAAMKYFLFGTGPWTLTGIDMTGTFHSKFIKDKTSLPDLQIMLLSYGLSNDKGVKLRKNLGISDKIYDEYFAPLTYNNVISIVPVLLHPKSRGEVRLRSANPFDAPLIDPRYLSDEEDLLKLIDGLEFVKKLVNTDAMKKVGAHLNDRQFPGCENFHFDTLDYWKCYVRHVTLTVYHPSGTCRMGDVVDSNFRVYNTKNLFVVDASVFPSLPSGNTNAPVAMLSEKAARLIIQDFHKTNSRKQYRCCNKTDIFLLFDNC